jgi:ABC-type spermidine/putrescine transport system permease subunit II
LRDEASNTRYKQPTLAAVSTLLLVFVTVVILAAEYFQRRADKRG